MLSKILELNSSFPSCIWPVKSVSLSDLNKSFWFVAIKVCAKSLGTWL